MGVVRLPPSSGPGLCGQAALRLSIPTQGSGVWLTTIGTRSFSEGNNEARLTSITVTNRYLIQKPFREKRKFTKEMIQRLSIPKTICPHHIAVVTEFLFLTLAGSWLVNQWCTHPSIHYFHSPSYHVKTLKITDGCLPSQKKKEEEKKGKT